MERRSLIAVLVILGLVPLLFYDLGPRGRTVGISQKDGRRRDFLRRYAIEGQKHAAQKPKRQARLTEAVKHAAKLEEDQRPWQERHRKEGAQLKRATCIDTPGWVNGIDKMTCQHYAHFWWCADGGVVPGQEWAVFNQRCRVPCINAMDVGFWLLWEGIRSLTTTVAFAGRAVVSTSMCNSSRTTTRLSVSAGCLMVHRRRRAMTALHM